MIHNKNIPYFLLAFAIAFFLKIGYTMSSTADLRFLLKPTDALVGFFIGSNSIFTESGYWYQSLNIVIDKSCSGLNLWVISFMMLSSLGLKYAHNFLERGLTIPFALLAAYLFTLFANTSRICTSIVLEKRLKLDKANLHEAIGIFVNLTFLILTYLVIEKFLSKKINHAKLT